MALSSLFKGLLAAALLGSSVWAAAKVGAPDPGPRSQTVFNKTGGAALQVPAGATFIDIDLSNWKTFGTFGNPLNSSLLLSVGAGRQVLGFDYQGLSFNTLNGSFLEELVLSVNTNEPVVSQWLDWAPSSTRDAGSESGLNGSWGGPSGAAGPVGAGAPFVALADGMLFITVYESFDDPVFEETAPTTQDALITSGTLRIYLNAPAIPEPGTYALMAVGLLGLMALQRRRGASAFER